METSKTILLSLASAVLLSGCASLTFDRQRDEPGRDLLVKFQQAQAGRPLRCVAIGGSITQAGKGWVGDWLRAAFPNSAVVMHNAGMSATGSMLGMFRLERDVIACQPDLVFVEFAVNDGGLDDETAYWSLESIVRRLKSLPDPPAVVFVETAARDQSKRHRHESIARHYGLLNIDLQLKSDAYLQANGLKWNALFGDAVHPNQTGHEFYAQVIAEALQPYLIRAKTLTEPVTYTPSLPKQFSPRKLVLDGRMVPIAGDAGWRRENSLPFWWNKFFNGVVSADQPGTTLRIPFRGTVAGLYYALSKTYGMFYANVDGEGFREVLCNTRGGYSYTVFQNLTPEEHVLNIALPKNSVQGQGVKLGYLLLGGETDAADTSPHQGAFTAEKLAAIRFKEIAASRWQWTGPYGDVRNPWPDDATLPNLARVFPPEQDSAQTTVTWKPVTLDTIDFARLTGFGDRGVCYAKTTLDRPEAGLTGLALRVDYWAKVWVNGKPALTVDRGHGSPRSPIYFAVDLKQGANDILVKVQSGSRGNRFSLEINTQEQ
jgi:lysophospholipase L1-like esterase